MLQLYITLNRQFKEMAQKKKKRKIQEGIYSFFSIAFFCTFPGETPGDAFKLCHVNRSFLTTRGLNIV